jgi:protein-L-isoaspartate(D-aspartate) O-methyltransferase
MKQRPTFPAQLDATLAKTRPNAQGLKAHPATVPLKPAAAPRPVVAVAQSPRANAIATSTALPAKAMPVSASVDSSAVRKRMSQMLAEQGVRDPMVLAAMGAIERHRFVDTALANQAYEDTSLPIGLGQTISKPGVVARMAELLRNGREGRLGRVLEIGTGCGYQAAVLSLLADEVYSIERLRGLHEKARENLRLLRVPNLHLLFGDGMEGYAKGAPYAAIISAAGGDAVPQAWVDQLAMGGRLVAPVAQNGTAGGAQALMVIDKTPQGIRHAVLEAVHFVPLKSGVA